MSTMLLGVKIDNLNPKDSLERIDVFLKSNIQNTVFTPNPEMIVLAQKNSEFKNILNSGSLNICDGKGIELVSGGKLKRIAGVDFMLEICNLAGERGKSVYLLGSGDQEVVRLAAENLKKKFPKLNVVGCDRGIEIELIKSKEQIANSKLETIKQFNPIPLLVQGSNSSNQIQYSENDNQRIINDINSKKPDILFVAFGHYKQEKWIVDNLHKISSVKVAMGVGGSFDYLSGKIKRAPLFMRNLGLEWLYRLSVEPGRYKRIFNATVKFLYYFYFKYKK